ncbi:meprin A subunit alpha-like [Ptychodera flava]|uniref:meprin A subunit alpha-like n=1 Tax=Ptychodera flava TaxID=63121 RepID=UPI003969F02E
MLRYFIAAASLVTITAVPFTREEVDQESTSSSEAETVKNAMDTILAANSRVSGTLLEGDIVPGYITHRNAARDTNLLWHDKTIPYMLDEELSSRAISSIQEAIEDFHLWTCLRFQLRTIESDYVVFSRGDGCHSRVGRGGGLQKISIDGGCEYKGTIIHEIMHAIGFWHEHSRYDRDDYVTVYIDNVIEGKELNFDKYPFDVIDTLGVDYDYRSIMHYSNVTFSKNASSLPTITPRSDISVVLGQRNGFSELDLVKVNRLYSCGVLCPPLAAPVHGQMNGDCCLVGTTLKFNCELGYTLYGSMTLTCQSDGTWNSNQPMCKETSTVLCDFSGGLCGFTQPIKNDHFDWTLHQANTPSAFTGPVADHTTGTREGKYLYIETSSPRTLGDSAILESPVYPTKNKCLRFYYHMYGQDVDTLNVFIREQKLLGTSNLGNLALTLNGNQGTEWKKAEVSITPQTPFQVIFQGQRGSSYRGDIAIDDVSVTDGRCLSPGSPFVCDFEAGMCDFYQDSYDDFDWLMETGSTLTASTGPSADHTTSDNTGHYIYTEASTPQYHGARSRIISPSFPATNGSCITFFYHMYGDHMGTLNIYIYNDGDVMSDPVWSTTGNQGNHWKQLKIYLVRKSNYKVTFEGVIGNSYQSDLALDDIELKQGDCQP